MRLGFYNTLLGIRKLFRKKTGSGLDNAMRSLKGSVRRMKEQVRESITAHLMDYKENFKYQYLFKLADAVSNSLYEDLLDRLRAFTGSLSDLSSLIENTRADKDRIVEEFVSLEKSASSILGKIKKAEEVLEDQELLA